MMKSSGMVWFAVAAVAVALIAEPAQAGGQKGPAAPPGGSAALSEAEAETMTFMREEEKLARDVYWALYDIWGLPVFDRIADSEQAHMDALLRLLQKYDLPDPAQETGVFTDPFLQQLYGDLVTWGAKSELDAYAVGVFIEETDIADLLAAMEETAKRHLDRVYSNLLAASQNHLAIFQQHLDSLAGPSLVP